MLAFGPHVYIRNPYPLQRHGLYNRFIYNYISGTGGTEAERLFHESSLYM